MLHVSPGDRDGPEWRVDGASAWGRHNAPLVSQPTTSGNSPNAAFRKRVWCHRAWVFDKTGLAIAGKGSLERRLSIKAAPMTCRQSRASVVRDYSNGFAPIYPLLRWRFFRPY